MLRRAGIMLRWLGLLQLPLRSLFQGRCAFKEFREDWICGLPDFLGLSLHYITFHS